MALGTSLLALTLALALLATIGFGGERWARRYVWLAFICTLCACLYLWLLIFQNRFAIDYVWAYSSLSLPWFYKISVFWAGQQGSLLLWLVFHAAIGTYLIYKKSLRRSMFVIYFLLEAMLALLMLTKNPFLASGGQIPADGMGMNPLLQDPWMAIHPPLIFFGYALLAVPYAASLGALWDKQQTDFLSLTRRYLFLSLGFLGAGIFVGGYWAYKVLGWGGYWGWDPVENASLVPWLATTVLAHLSLAARRRACLLPYVHLAAIFAFSLTLYGTFLARSGLLGDFSVHSFTGESIGLYLAACNALIFLGGLAILIFRLENLPKGTPYTSHKSRLFFLLLGQILLGLIAFIVFVGMSMPMLSTLWGAPSVLDTAFYPRVLAPLAVALVLTLFFSTLWGMNKLSIKAYAFAVPLLLGIVFVMRLGAPPLWSWLLAGGAVCAFCSSLWAWHKKILSHSATLAHGGVCLALLAFVTTGAASSETSLNFTQGETQTAFGHTLRYDGVRYDAQRTSKAYVFTLDGHEISTLTKLDANEQPTAKEPAIYKSLVGDFYLVPEPKEAELPQVTLAKGHTAMAGSLAYLLDNVEETKIRNEILCTAHVSITDGDRIETVEPTLRADALGAKSPSVSAWNNTFRVRLLEVSGNLRHVVLEILPTETEESTQPLAIHLSFKPFIWLLWLGAVCVVLGSLGAVRVSRIEQGKGNPPKV